ncbi:MAG: hypothetical protein GIKADHBN_02227 [Phycisphaerales bacterium]|nr:hypothetical protein [Phycisphaerales bacterium]
MEEIRRVVKSAGHRLVVLSFLRLVTLYAIAGAIGLFVALVVQRMFGLTWPWQTIFLSTGGAVVLAAIVTAVAQRKDTLGVARELDDRAGLRESLSTAMCVAKAEDPWSKVVVETARQRAAAVKVREAVPMEAPRLWPFALGSAAALALAWFVMPTWDVLKILEKQQVEAQKQQELVAARSEVEAATKKLDAILEKAKVEFKDEKTDEPADSAARAAELKNPEEVRRAAVKRLSDVADRLSDMKDSEKAQQMEALKDQLRQLRQTSDGPLHEFQRQLARGNFDQAKQELENLAKNMADGKMSPEDAAKAQKQLEDLAKQLEKLAGDKKELQEALEKQGLSKEQAQELMKKAASGNSEEIQKAMEAMKQLSPEQKQALMKQAMAQMKAAQQMQQMSDASKQMAEGMQAQKMDQQGAEGMQGMMAELSAAEQMSGEMQAAMAAMDEVNAQLAALGKCLGTGDGQDGDFGNPRIGEWSEGESQRQGSGSGGPGKGLGPSPEAAATDYAVKKDKAKVNTQEGPIIGSRLVWGEQVRGESRAAFSQAVEAGSEAASEALETKQVPRPYHNAVRQYFGTLTDKAGDKKDAKPAEKKDEKPAEDAKDSGGGK